MEKLSQRDVRWEDVKINDTKYTLGTDGCLITCLAMASGTTPDVVVKKIGFDGAEVNWTGLDKIGLELVEKTNPYDDIKVKQYIQENGFCIVRVDFDGNLKSNDTHFVLFIGNKRMIDPWTGNECATSKYPLTGFRAVRKVVMANELQTCLADREKFWKERDQLLEIIGTDSIENATNVIGGYKSRATTAENKLGEAQGEVKNREEQVIKLKDRVLELEKEEIRLINLAKDNWIKYDEEGKAKGEIVNELQVAKNTIIRLQEEALKSEITITIKDLIKLILSQKITISKK